MISPRYATMFCFVQTDAALGAGDARPAHRRVRQALVRPHLGGRPALHERHGVRARQRRRPACAVEPETPDELAFGEALDALLRQLALEIVADGEGAERVGPDRRARAAPDAVEPVARAVPNSPLVKTALHGGDPNFGRILQAAGQAWPPGEPFVADLEIEGRQVVSAGDAHRPRRRRVARAGGGVRGARGGVRAHAAGRGRRDRGLLQRPVGGLRALQRELHVMRDVATLLEALPVHPGVPRPDGGDQVRRRGDDRPRAEGGVRARRGAPQVRRA